MGSPAIKLCRRPSEVVLTKAAWSLLAYGVYIASAGVVMLVVPQLFMLLLGLPEGSETALRFGGVLALALGFYDVLAARAELVTFFRWSLFPRSFAFVVFAALFALGKAPAGVLLVGIADLASVGWTWLALRADAKT